MIKTMLLAGFATAGLTMSAQAMPTTSVGPDAASVTLVRGVCDAYGHCYNTGGHGNDAYVDNYGRQTYGFDAQPRPRYYQQRQYYRSNPPLPFIGRDY